MTKESSTIGSKKSKNVLQQTLESLSNDDGDPEDKD